MAHLDRHVTQCAPLPRPLRNRRATVLILTSGLRQRHPGQERAGSAALQVRNEKRDARRAGGRSAEQSMGE